MILCGLAASCATTTVMAQATGNRSSYFLEGSVYRHELNPAFQGERNYVGMPALGNFSVGAQGTAGLGDFLYVKDNGDLMTFMHPDVSAKTFLNDLPRRTKLGINLNENILSTGFFAWGGFNTFGLSIKSDTRFSSPDDLFKFMKSGVDSPEGTHYKVNDLRNCFELIQE